MGTHEGHGQKVETAVKRRALAVNHGIVCIMRNGEVIDEKGKKFPLRCK
jgi:hypothetical protein